MFPAGIPTVFSDLFSRGAFDLRGRADFGNNKRQRREANCTLVGKETICNTRGEPVVRLTFRPPEYAPMTADAALRQVVLVRGSWGPPRMYSPTCLQRPDGTFDLVVRAYKGGQVSPWLAGLPINSVVPMVYPFPSVLRLDRRNAGRFVGLIAFGIGITELCRTAERELADPSVQEVVLLYATRTMEEQRVMGPELDELLRCEPGRFRLERVLSREKTPGAHFGRVDAAMLQAVFPWPESCRAAVRFHTAGTREMMATVDRILQSLGYSPPNYKLIRGNSVRDMMADFR